jgi:hypothetical protein
MEFIFSRLFYFKNNYSMGGKPPFGKASPMFKTVSQIKAVHTGYWFSRDTVRFFSSRFYRTVYAGKYFVSSEQFIDHNNGITNPRKYTIREYDAANDKITTVGEFQQYATLESARGAIKLLIKEENNDKN